MLSQPTSIVRGLLLLVTVETLLSVPLLSWELAIGSHMLLGIVFSLFAAVGIISVIWRWGTELKGLFDKIAFRLSTIPTGKWLMLCIGLGIILRVGWVWLYPAPQRSDQATYFALAQDVVLKHRYGISNGGLAYWPPGYPIFLCVWFLVFGTKTWVPLIANLCLFSGIVAVVDRLACRISGLPSARLATLLLVPWPTLAMIAGFAGKEMLVVFLLCLVLLVYSASEDRQDSRTPFTFLAGLLLGFTILTQPAFQLFPFVLGAYEYFRKRLWTSAVARILSVTVGLCIVILPWTLRNHRVLGAWVPISTNGGDVLYRANNPWATGGYTPRGEQDLSTLDEVTRGRVGMHLGLRWILTNPRKFLLLGLHKQILFLGDDAQGAYETLKRGLGIGGIRYAVWKGISNLYWWLLWSLISLALVVRRRLELGNEALHATIILAVLYLLVIHSVFESGAKYHEPLMGFLAVLAAQVAAPSRHLSGSSESHSL